jgi:protein-ribulosamine 3-kinase
MFLSGHLIRAIELVLQQQGLKEPLRVIRTVSGGSINKVYQLKAGNFYFLKVNDAHKFPGMFLAEAEGLKLIRQTNSIGVPQVIAHGESNGEQFLLMHWIENGHNSSGAQADLGRQLAAMHRYKGTQFGLDHNNYMGSLTQSNTFHAAWTDFFIRERLQPQLNIAIQKGLADSSLNKDFQNLFSRLDTLYPHEAPSLVHGDLWSGNYMISSSGEPVLIDPAVAYAHREVDIAMSALFGGFDADFYHAYNEVFPLEKGWEKRIDLWNLYPLLVHLNLFGTGYLHQVKSSLKEFL